MKEIGGYIEFEHYHNSFLHDDGILLNSGRSGLAYLIETRGITHIALPYYLCDSVRDVCKSCSKAENVKNVDIVFYKINNDFLPVYAQDIPDRYVYIVNYFGFLKSTDIKALKQKYENKIIIDNSQAFFSDPLNDIDTLYSCRKFFGVSDGGILYIHTQPYEKKIIITDIDKSSSRFSFLLGRFEGKASDYYLDYKKNNERFKKDGLKRMSLLTENILRSIDYEYVKQKRSDNYETLNELLRPINQLRVGNGVGAFAYPLLVSNGAIVRKELLKKKIYIPILWPNVLEDVDRGSLEYKYASDILPLPVDQRYGKEEMILIAEAVKKAVL